MAPESAARGTKRGGVQVRTIQRLRSVASGSRAPPTHRSDRKSKPSARYRKALSRKNAHGGDFVKDDDAGRQFENRVLEVYAPADTSNESTRTVSLGALARLEGECFRLPSLSTMCINVISDTFNTHVLPLQSTSEALSRSDRRLKEHGEPRRRGLLGIGYAGYDEDRDQDFMPSDEEEKKDRKRRRSDPSRTIGSVRMEKGFLQALSSHNLVLLAPQLTLQLQQMLERKSPQSLSFDVLSRYFLSPAKVSYSRTFRALAIVGGVPVDEAVRMLKALFVSPASTPYAAPTIVRPNAATTLRSLHLQAFTRLTSRHLEPLFNETVSLEEVCLRGCVNVTSEAIGRLVNTCGQTLRSVNLNWTSVGLAGVEHLVRGAPHLVTLKIAHVQGLTDANISAMMSRATQQTLMQGTVPLSKLRKVKLNGTHIGITGVASLLKHCGPRLESLDVGNTRVGGSGCIDLLFMALAYDEGGPKGSYSTGSNRNVLQKINLSSLEIPETDLARFLVAVAKFHALRSINLNYVQSRKGSTVNGLSDAMIATLMSSITERTKVSYEGYAFDSIAVATSSNLSGVLSPARFLIDHDYPSGPRRRIVRVLNLSGQNLSRQILDPLSFQHGTSLNVEVLNLHGCKMPDEFDWRSLGVNGRLRSIDLSGTAVAKKMVDALISENPCLEKMDLTGCRSIPVRARRDYFSVNAEEANVST